MRTKLKPLSQQVVVITGASSGIGLETAREAARKGARLVLVARSEDALKELVDEIASDGGEAIYVVADVGEEAEIAAVANRAVEHFGGFDTWVSNAGVSIYGSLDGPSSAEYRRLFDTNFWGAVFGALKAREHLEQHGGAIIVIGSAVSDFSIPIQGMYSASKHAVKGFVDALRLETDKRRSPVSITLIKPASINTPLPDHAANYMDREPRLPPPVYEPEAVASAILYAAEHPSREISIGVSAKVGALGRHLLPRLADRILNTYARRWQMKDRLDSRTGSSILFEPTGKLENRHKPPGPTFRISPYTYATTYGKGFTISAFAALAVLGVYQYRRWSRKQG